MTVIVLWLFLTVPWVFPDLTFLLFEKKKFSRFSYLNVRVKVNRALRRIIIRIDLVGITSNATYQSPMVLEKFLTLNAPITTKVVCISRVLKC